MRRDPWTRTTRFAFPALMRPAPGVLDVTTIELTDEAVAALGGPNRVADAVRTMSVYAPAIRPDLCDGRPPALLSPWRASVPSGLGVPPDSYCPFWQYARLQELAERAFATNAPGYYLITEYASAGWFDAATSVNCAAWPSFRTFVEAVEALRERVFRLYDLVFPRSRLR